MTDVRPEDFGMTPTVEVRVYRNDVLIQRVLCETEEDAIAAVEAWEEEPAVRCEVDDLSAPRRRAEAREVERTDTEEYPTVAESTGATVRRI